MENIYEQVTAYRNKIQVRSFSLAPNDLEKWNKFCKENKFFNKKNHLSLAMDLFVDIFKDRKLNDNEKIELLNLAEDQKATTRGEYVCRSFAVEESALKNWNDFCKHNFTYFNKKILLTLAIKYYMKHYQEYK